MVTQEQIIEAIKADNGLISAILPTIEGTDIGKRMLEAKADEIAGPQISEKTKLIYGRIDDDMEAELGIRPERGDDGSKEKTPLKVKELFAELKSLREKKDSLDNDKEIQRLKQELEAAKKTDDNQKVQQLQEQFDTAKQQWLAKEQELTQKIQDEKTSNVDFQKSSFIDAAFNDVKFDPNTPESMRKLAIKDAKEQLKQNSEIRDGKLVFLKDGKVELNDKFEPMDAQGKLASLESIRDISLKKENPGGGAPKEIGKVQTIQVEGKDTKKLNLAPGSFKTRSEFTEVAEKALTENGITRSNPEFTNLMTAAYNEHKVSEMPRD